MEPHVKTVAEGYDYVNLIGGFHKVPVQRTWWSVLQKYLIRI